LAFGDKIIALLQRV